LAAADTLPYSLVRDISSIGSVIRAGTVDTCAADRVGNEMAITKAMNKKKRKNRIIMTSDLLFENPVKTFRLCLGE
jgi:hypothetical protein